MTALDKNALKQGALVALVFAVPFSIAARYFAEDDNSDLALLLSLLALVGFVLGAGVASWAQTKRMPLAHGLICAGGTYLAAQAVFVAVKLFRGGSVNLLGIFFTFTAVLGAGLIGGGLGSALRKRGILPSGKGR